MRAPRRRKGKTITVTNVAPANIVVNSTASHITENQSITLSGSFTDPGILDTHTVDINWGDGSDHTLLSLAANVLVFGNASHQYLDNPTGQPTGSFPIRP